MRPLPIVLAIAAVATIATATACEPQSSAHPGAPAVENISTPDISEDAYLAALHDAGISSPKGDEWLVIVGQTACDVLDEQPDPTLSYLMGVADRAGDELSSGDPYFLTGAAVGAFCPEYGYLIDGAR